MYSLWLKPSVESYRRYQSIISNLASDYKTPNFEPHVTILSDIEYLKDGDFYQIGVLAALTKVFDVKLTVLSMQNSYFKSLYGGIQNNKEINSLNSELQSLFPQNVYSFQPHFSLLYSNVPKGKKLKIIKEQRETIPKLIGLEGIQVVKTIGKPADWEIVEYFPFYE
jgi:2'-5' RNA ligase